MIAEEGRIVDLTSAGPDFDFQNHALRGWPSSSIASVAMAQMQKRDKWWTCLCRFSLLVGKLFTQKFIFQAQLFLQQSSKFLSTWWMTSLLESASALILTFKTALILTLTLTSISARLTSTWILTGTILSSRTCPTLILLLVILVRSHFKSIRALANVFCCFRNLQQRYGRQGQGLWKSW